MNQLTPHNLILYSTSFCHLCEEAEQLLKQANQHWQCVEITEDSVLLNRYGLKIPVLQNITTQEELSWPFSMTDIKLLAK